MSTVTITQAEYDDLLSQIATLTVQLQFAMDTCDELQIDLERVDVHMFHGGVTKLSKHK